MKIVIASDHAGIETRKKIVDHMENSGYDITDLGTHKEKANYVNEGLKVAEYVSSSQANYGIVVCGTGIGISIAANKVRGIRCALVSCEEISKLSRQHNDANVLALGARVNQDDEILKIVNAFFTTEFEGGRHEERLDTLSDYEESCLDC